MMRAGILSAISGFIGLWLVTHQAVWGIWLVGLGFVLAIYGLSLTIKARKPWWQKAISGVFNFAVLVFNTYGLLAYGLLRAVGEQA